MDPGRSSFAKYLRVMGGQSPQLLQIDITRAVEEFGLPHGEIADRLGITISAVTRLGEGFLPAHDDEMLAATTDTTRQAIAELLEQQPQAEPVVVPLRVRNA